MVEDVDRAIPAEARAALGARTTRIGGALVSAATATGHVFINRVTGLGVHAPVEPADLEAVLRTLDAPDRAPNYIIPLWPTAAPATLPEWLADHGLVPFRRRYVVLRHDLVTVPSPATALRISRASPRDAAAVGRVVADAFDLPHGGASIFAALIDRPGWHVYAAFAQARLVAVGGLFVRDGLGMCAFGATVPEQRDRGAHKALIARRLQVARALGCDSVLVETGLPVGDEPNPSLHNLRELGFADFAIRPVFAPPGTTWNGR